jgi:hypothetical protein
MDHEYLDSKVSRENILLHIYDEHESRIEDAMQGRDPVKRVRNLKPVAAADIRKYIKGSGAHRRCHSKLDEARVRGA